MTWDPMNLDQEGKSSRPGKALEPTYLFKPLDIEGPQMGRNKFSESLLLFVDPNLRRDSCNTIWMIAQIFHSIITYDFGFL